MHLGEIAISPRHTVDQSEGVTSVPGVMERWGFHKYTLQVNLEGQEVYQAS